MDENGWVAIGGIVLSVFILILIVYCCKLIPEPRSAVPFPKEEANHYITQMQGTMFLYILLTKCILKLKMVCRCLGHKAN